MEYKRSGQRPKQTKEIALVYDSAFVDCAIVQSMRTTLHDYSYHSSARKAAVVYWYTVYMVHSFSHNITSCSIQTSILSNIKHKATNSVCNSCRRTVIGLCSTGLESFSRGLY
jgi:hypothetical protein